MVGKIFKPAEIWYTASLAVAISLAGCADRTGSAQNNVAPHDGNRADMAESGFFDGLTVGQEIRFGPGDGGIVITASEDPEFSIEAGVVAEIVRIESDFLVVRHIGDGVSVPVTHQLETRILKQAIVQIMTLKKTD